jgi:formylglycine-generating enzyme required for sulfatase activity
MNKEDPLGIVGTLVAEKYRVEQLVGEGGFAVVYRALHTGLQLPVAIKFFNALAFVPTGRQKDFEEAFINEGKLLTRLSSRTSSIVQAHDIGTLKTADSTRIPYLVLEWVDGRTLDQVLESERSSDKPPWTLPEVRRVLGAVALAMDVVHGEGVAHRDLKPANILLLGKDPRREAVRIKILDFGVAKMMLDNAQFHAALAVTGRIMFAFTPMYGAPEQFSRKYGATGPWTDVYALALIAVEMLTGKPPLDGEDVPALQKASCDPESRPTPRARGVALPDSVEAVFAKALAVDPAERYARAGELWTAFEGAIASMFSSPEWQTPSPSMVSARPARSAKARVVAAKPTQKKRRLWPLGLAAAGALIAVVAGIALKKEPEAALPKAPERVSTPSTPSSAAAGGSCPAGMRQVAGARFFMGTDEKGVPKNQRPAHQVALQAYCIDEKEVSVDEYKRCADAGACREPSVSVEWPSIREKERVIYGTTCNGRAADRVNHPMNCVTWEEATALCVHRQARLPTEAEWEYAARGKKLIGGHPWGAAKPTARFLNACDADCVRWSQRNQAGLSGLVKEQDGFATTAPVGSFSAGCSELGVCDLAGNVREWTSDAYAAYVATGGKPGKPSSDRVVRGGAWTSGEAIEARRTYRESVPPGVRRHDVGFRCARSLR